MPPWLNQQRSAPFSSTMEEGVVGFEDTEEDKAAILKKKKKKKMSLTKKPGGFQSMGLSFPVLKAVQKRGYKVPTPIQRKTIPLVLEGRDVVAMARTGSGKTASFLVPLFEKLKGRKTQSGIRAIILSPTRELAIQTLRFVKELGRFTGLKHAVIVGGDSMEAQFSELHNSPDIVIATPGRLLHVCVEMELKFSHLEMIIFDEADRLFEMGFGEQLGEIVRRLPETRQTLLFSATLPKVLVEFARAGLSDPVLIRLDVETKLPEALNALFVSCRSDEKPAALLCLLKNFVKMKARTIIFAATKHHVEYLHLLLDLAGVRNTYLYSELDPSARKINTAKFQTGRVSTLVVTDIAARGIDIPCLDYVINYNFPAKPKLFVHRVGRCARAGREGWAVSLVGPDEVCYMLDIHLFLGRPLQTVPATTVDPPEPTSLGSVPRAAVEPQLAEISNWEATNNDLVSIKRVSENAYKHYIKCRQGASRESVRRGKELELSILGPHWCFYSRSPREDVTVSAAAATLRNEIHNYKPQGTIFEIGQKSQSELYTIMKKKRQVHGNQIFSHRQKELEKKVQAENNKGVETILEESSPQDVDTTFSRVVTEKRRLLKDSQFTKYSRKVDKDNFIPYKPADYHTEEGLAVNNFEKSAAAAGLDLTADTERMLKSSYTKKVWDRKRKKMVGVDVPKKKIRSESGGWIDASFKSGRYQKWMDKSKASSAPSYEEEDDENTQPIPALKKQPYTHWGRHNMKVHEKKSKELKRPEQILKARDLKAKRRMRNGRKKKSKK